MMTLHHVNQRRMCRTRCMVASTLQVLLWLAYLLAGTSMAQDARPVIRLSGDNGPAHSHTRALQAFALEAEKATGGTFAFRMYPNARLFRDSDVVRALAAGQVEMAAPGIWILADTVPDFSILLTALFYGRRDGVQQSLVDGMLGEELKRKLEAALPVVVLGRWLELGYSHIFTVSHKIAAMRDLQGLRMRVPAGNTSLWRLQQLGVRPVVVPWPDVRQQLQLRAFDGLLSTYETVVSARLWELGIRHVYEEYAYLGFYVPLVSRALWDRLDTQQRAALHHAWEQNVDEARRDAANGQRMARSILAERGVTVSMATEAESAQVRALLLQRESALRKDLRIDAGLYDRVQQAVMTYRGH